MPRNPLLPVIVLAAVLIAAGVAGSLYMDRLSHGGGMGGLFSTYDAKARADEVLAEIRAERQAAAQAPAARATAAISAPAPEADPQPREAPALRTIDRVTLNRFNEAFDLPLVTNGRMLWDESPALVAQRLGMKLDTRTKRHQVYSRDRGLDNVLGAQPENILLYAVDGRIDEIVISYANRGTYPPREFERRLDSDEAAVRRNLSFLLGPTHPVERRVTKGSPVYKVMHWEGREAEVMLFLAANDFVEVRLRNPADDPSDIKVDTDALAKGVLRFRRGDVLIADIPLIKQGMRPYCVPVTVERVLRHLGLPNSMYALAAAGKVSHRGCNTFLIFEQLEEVLHKHGLGLDFRHEPFREIDGELKASIDAGLPVIWLVHGYVDIFLNASQRRLARESSQSTGAWQLNLITAANFAKVNEGQYHACVINGYNERTGEISVLDEIGQFWLSEAEAAKVTQPFLFYVRPKG